MNKNVLSLSKSILIKIESDILELKFEGLGTQPNKVCIKDLMGILENFNDALKAMILSLNQTLKIDDDYLSLISIDHKNLSFKVQLKTFVEVGKNAYMALASIIGSGNMNGLPVEAIEPIEAITYFNKKWNCKARLGYSVKHHFKEMISFTLLNPLSELIFQQNSTYYGILKKLGGEKPVAHILAINGKYIHAEISKEQVLAFSHLLYKEVKTTGNARYNSQTLQLKSFQLESMVRYKILLMGETINALKRTLKPIHA